MRHQRGAHRTYELVRGHLLEDGAEVAGDVLACADGEQEDEEHWHPHRPCNKHGVPEGLVCLGYCVCIARYLLRSSVMLQRDAEEKRRKRDLLGIWQGICSGHLWLQEL
jgi:hypothetical protein